ncbi:DUF6541 family protein [Arthrobacter sp. SLBN-122]|uniref:DUF6541 family protein n=1 Tax=Arthrobacter sp. SLBN-122 TaxID=2768455 RepID=UPI0011538710|nr:DUF6541 family protein [Arthrobacter sp. SLBN-122]TQJ33078.1 hypothetical protein FBY36_0282 [Arthrobacter sp. SLBN-122]
MSWFDALPQFVLAVALLFLPGAAVGTAARLGVTRTVAAAPAVSISIIAVAAIAAPLVGVAWSLLPAAAATIGVCATAFAASTLLKKKDGTADAKLDERPRHWIVASVAATAIAAVLVGRRLVRAIGSPESFSQTFDNVFHLNAIRYILDTGSGSSLTVSNMTGGSAYPAAWHDLVSLLVKIGGGEITSSVNVINIVVAALVWPVGCIYLSQAIWGRRPAVSVAAGILSAAFGAFPISLLDFGVLYPNFLALALLPMVFALGLDALGLSAASSHSRLLSLLLLLAVFPGMALAHPSAAMAWLALMLPPTLYAYARALVNTLRYSKGRARIVVPTVSSIAFVAAIVLIRVLWDVVRPPAETAFWPPVESTGQAIGEVISSSAIGRPVAWGVMLLTLLGIYVTIRSARQLWLLGTFAVAGFLFVVVSSFPADDFRLFLTGIWYNDPPRLAALLPMVTIPLACRGAVAVWNQLCTIVQRAPGLVRGRFLQHAEVAKPGRTLQPAMLVAAAATVLVLALTVATQRGNVNQAEASMAGSYRLSENSPLISTDEMALIERLPGEVPEDAVLVGNPWNGSSLAYAFADRKLVQLHILSAVPQGVGPLLNGPPPAKDDPAVCPTVESLKVDYILDFGHREVHGRDSGYKGLDALIAAGMAKLEDSQGEAKLYKLDLCPAK